MGFSVWQLAIVAIVVLVLFGRGRISEMMGDFGKGISSFKKGMNEDEHTTATPPESNAKLRGPAHDAKPAGETVESAERTDTPRN